MPVWGSWSPSCSTICATMSIHRIAHRVRWVWASHVIHHSSQHYNLSTALRQTWTGLLRRHLRPAAAAVPARLSAGDGAFVGGINLIYQFWIHTEVIGRMPRWFEAVFNTPSHHRVHHATNPRYLDTNYAGMLIIWDRMFGTFAPELDEDRPRYGIVKNLGSFNLAGRRSTNGSACSRTCGAAPTLAARWNYLIKPPGWSHDGSRETSERIKELWEQRERERDAWTKPGTATGVAERSFERSLSPTELTAVTSYQ